jgi:IgA-specific serine endopeptidase
MNPQKTPARPSVDLEATDQFPVLDATAYEADVLSREPPAPPDRQATAAAPDPPAAESPAPDPGAPNAAPRMADSDDMLAVENWIAQKTEELRAYHEALTLVQRERAAALARAEALSRELSEASAALEAAKGRERSLAEALSSEQEAARQRAAEIAQRETRAREGLAAEVKALQAQLANCLESLQSRESYRALYESSLQELDAELAAAKLRTAEQEARANQLETELQASDQRLQIAVRERDAARNLPDTEINQHATERGEVEQKRSALETRLAQLSAEHADKCAQLLAMEATLTAAQQRAQAEALASGTAAERLRELESAIAARQAESSQARLEIERNRALLADLTAALLKSQTMFSDQGRLLEEREAAASAMAASQAEQAASIMTLRGQIEELTAERAMPAAERRALEERVAALTKEAAESESRIFRLEAINSELRASVGHLNTSLAEREAELQRAAQMASINAYALERVQSSIDDLGRTLTSAEGGPTQAQVGILTRLDNGQNHSVVVRGRTTIGRDRDNDLPLAMRSVSRHHAVLIPAFRTAFIQDLRSTNGVLVNQRRVRCARLEHGDVITCGEAQFRYTVTPAPGGAFRGSAPSPVR